MKEVISKIKKWFLENTQKQRFAYFDIGSNGLVTLKKFLFFPERNEWKEISSIFLGVFDEKTFFLDKKNFFIFRT